MIWRMANQEHLDVLAKGVEVWNQWRDRYPDIRPRLDSANLSAADLRRANLSASDLSFANLGKAKLNNANLSLSFLLDSDLHRSSLISAHLNHAYLAAADLRGANLTRADLGDANLYAANLDGANLTKARVLWTVFACDLSTTKGLDSIHHDGPSCIDLDTVFDSKGKIPEAFLRGCGVPENFIAYIRSLTGTALEFNSVFISYSTKDQPFADRLYTDLQARGVRCWFAPHDIQGGRKIHEQLDEAIRMYDKLLLVLSDASMNSNWVKTEIANTRAREQQQNRQMLFPITLVPFERVRRWKLFDADTGIDSAREIREYFIPDFSNWKDHDSYQRAFERLVRGLKASPPKPATL
jgi:hypothetical protein